MPVECPAFLFFTFAAFSAFGQTDTNALQRLAPPYGELPPVFWEQHGAAVLAAVCLIALLAVLVAWKMLQRRPAGVLPPATVARAALTKLRHQPEDGKCLSEISQVLRRYVAVAFEFPPGELTTAEFCAALASHEQIGGELGQAISNFLRECDTRKFSAANPNSPMNAAGRASEMVELAEKTRARRDACPTQK